MKNYIIFLLAGKGKKFSGLIDRMSIRVSNSDAPNYFLFLHQQRK